MVALLVLAAVIAGGIGGLAGGLHIAGRRTAAALKLARYRDAIALADDLIKTPDALDLRDRANKIVAAHRAATLEKEY